MLLNAPRHAVCSPFFDWEESPCLLCGSAVQTPLLEAADSDGVGLRFLIVKCNRCGLCYTNPRPDLGSINQFYPADYQCHQGKVASCKPAPYGARLARLLPIRGLARLLDFGCGAGDFLARMHALGWNVTGLDMVEVAVARVRDQHGLPAHVGTLPNPLWTDACFEAITMWQSLEHVHQPLDVLHAAYRLLTSGGKLIVTTPNFAGLGSRWFGSDWYGLDVPRHLTHFTPETLRMMLGRAGFEGIEIRQQRHNSWIRHSARGGFLKTRLGSGLVGWWGSMTGRAEGLMAIATK
jgi:SAM-dependent methyltransferase